MSYIICIYTAVCMYNMVEQFFNYKCNIVLMSYYMANIGNNATLNYFRIILHLRRIWVL